MTKLGPWSRSRRTSSLNEDKHALLLLGRLLTADLRREEHRNTQRSGQACTDLRRFRSCLCAQRTTCLAYVYALSRVADVRRRSEPLLEARQLELV
eukprot:scaffold996_cov409-Prasinococcus_capsulatus_cf.AAC.21